MRKVKAPSAKTTCRCGGEWQTGSAQSYRRHMNSDEHYRRTEPQAWAEDQIAEDHMRPYDSQGPLPGAWVSSFSK